MNKSQKNTLGVGLTLLVICLVYFILSQKEEPLSFELVPALSERVLTDLRGDSLNRATLEAGNRSKILI